MDLQPNILLRYFCYSFGLTYIFMTAVIYHNVLFPVTFLEGWGFFVILVSLSLGK